MTKLLLVCNPQSYHLGGHLISAANELNLSTEVCDVRNSTGRGILQKLSWRLRDRRPLKMKQFGKEVLDKVNTFRPTLLLATGICPLDKEILDAVGKEGVIRTNYLTDDPFNPVHRSKWFTQAISSYDFIFTPRHANENDLIQYGAKRVHYLPFGYNPAMHCPSAGTEETPKDIEVMFVGGADSDRIPIIRHLITNGVQLALYGGYWDKFYEFRPYAKGNVSLKELRFATNRAKVTLILVRKANRDGHVMRSYEAAATGGCLLVEDTSEHRDIFGDSVCYFKNNNEMLQQAQKLIKDKHLRKTSIDSVKRRIVLEGENEYRHRLRSILQTVQS